MTDSKIKCYTFYSYKGGSGRSTTCINTLIHLIDQLHADKEHPILLVDSDLESAGLTFFFGLEKRFDDLGLHTTGLLQNSSTQLEDGEVDRTFGTNPGKRLDVTASLINGMKALFPSVDIAGLFSDIRIYDKERLILRNIIEKTEKVRTGGKRIPIESRLIAKKYNLNVLLNRLNKIRDTATPEEKAAVVSDFLPTTKFIDISRFFGAEEGVVLFLGVDVNYVGKSVEFNGTAAAINTLIQKCSDRNFRAVVFDSSAGVQSSADALHSVSDVLVYCMRPSRQFVAGTMTQLSNYADQLEKSQKSASVEDESKEHKKSVIILPTAVPPSVFDSESSYSFNAFRKYRFDDIAQNILITYSQVVDNTFCKPDTALNEVEVFKWYEMILGSGYLPENISSSDEIYNTVKHLADPEQIVRYPDAKRAYDTYKTLAQRLVENS